MDRQTTDDRGELEARQARRMSWLPLTLGLSVLVAALLFPLAVAYTSAPDVLTCGALTRLQCVASWMRDLGPLGVLLSVLTMTLAALTMFPGEAAAMANGAVYGALWGSLLSWAGGMIGANIAFAAARAIGPHAIGLLLSRAHYARICAWTDSNGRLALMMARLIPLFPYFAINYTAGLIGMRWWPFNWISAIGMAPAAITFTTVGAHAGEISWLNWGAIVIGVVVALMLLARAVNYLWGGGAAAEIDPQ
jgi:uncharacterized membrane protein YdjX (TVP38/TMEM64 family)